MRIALDCRSLQEPQPTGVSVYTRQLFNAMLGLPAAGQHQFVGVLSGHSMQRPDLLAAAKGSLAEHIEWRVHPWPNKLLTAGILTMGRPRAAQLFGPVDVVFVPNMQFFPLQSSRTPYVLTVHDLSFERLPDCLDYKGRLRHRLLRTRQFVHQARHCIAVSEHTKHDMVELYGVNPANVSVVYPGVPEHPPTDLTAQLRRNTDGKLLPYILAISTIEPRKNIDTLVAAFTDLARQHPELQLVVVGGDGWKSADTRRRLDQHPQMHAVGYLDDAQKQALLRRASAFVYPSMYEGFGFPPLEAQAAGVPVIVGAHSSLPEVLGAGALYADVLDVTSLRRAMHTVLTEFSVRTDLVTAGKDNVRRFSWQTAATQTLQTILDAATTR